MDFRKKARHIQRLDHLEKTVYEMGLLFWHGRRFLTERPNWSENHNAFLVMSSHALCCNRCLCASLMSAQLAFLDCHHFGQKQSDLNNWFVVLPVIVILCRLPHHDGRLVLRVCVRGGGRQKVPPSWCRGSDATGPHCTSCLGPNGSTGITVEIQVLTPTSGQFDSALVLCCFYLSQYFPHTSFQQSLF